MSAVAQTDALAFGMGKQLRLLKHLCAAYDAGERMLHARRIAAVLDRLFEPSCLLSELDQPELQLLTTCALAPVREQEFLEALRSHQDADSDDFAARLDDHGQPHRLLPWEAWWNEALFVTREGGDFVSRDEIARGVTSGSTFIATSRVAVQLRADFMCCGAEDADWGISTLQQAIIRQMAMRC